MIRAVVYCCDVGFTKNIDYWFERPEVGKQCTIEIYPGCTWTVQTFNVRLARPTDNITTFFFRSDDESLFECLCDCITPEKGWCELKDMKKVS